MSPIYGIKFHEVEESYTSLASFLDGDTIPKFCEKPEGWVSSGKRVKRGLFVTATGQKISADLNASANMLIKASTQLKLKLDLAKVVKGLLTVPPRIFLWKNNCMDSPIFWCALPKILSPYLMHLRNVGFNTRACIVLEARKRSLLTNK